ncbi:MAG TPA: phosphatidate cytidylyltransferase [Acidobacteriaceae bacterium]|nr:phosphatidate cytidylyltransferase [Acidobacteriaceae bacterium]
MKRILTAVILIPLVLALILWGPLWLQMLSAWIIAELALREYLVLADASGARVPRWLVMAWCAALFAVAYWTPPLLLAAVGISALTLLGVCSLRSPLERILPDAAAGFFGLIYIALPLLFAPLLTVQENGVSLLLFLLVVVWGGDIVALYVGRLMGRHPMAPRLSPKKTWEGAAGSVIGSIAAGLGIVYFASHLYRHGIELLFYAQPWWYWTGMAILLNVAAQIGDLLESAIKRGAGVKDSGTLLPGHGGVLDRIDALLLAIPVLWYALLLRQAY